MGTPPDPATHAWRGDLADVALAGEVIASHYAAPVDRALKCDAVVYAAADDASDEICRVVKGDPFALLDSRGDWAWGYAGPDRRVGYVPVTALA